MNYTLQRHLTIISDSDFEKYITLDDNESAYHSFLVFTDKKPTTCKILAELCGKKSLADIHIVSFVRNQQILCIDGNITISQTGDQATGKLLEEVMILGDYSHTLTKPVLDIRNNNVSASHGAKIHRIDEAKLFYLSSRGLDKTQARQIIVEGMIHNLFDSDPTVSVIHNNLTMDISDVQQYKKILVKQIVSDA